MFPECPLLAKHCAEALTSLHHMKSPEEHITALSPGRETEALGLTVYKAGLRSPHEGLCLTPILYSEVQALRI